MNKQLTLLSMDDLEGIVGGNILITSEAIPNLTTKTICTQSKEPEMKVPPSGGIVAGDAKVSVELNSDNTGIVCLDGG